MLDIRNERVKGQQEEAVTGMESRKAPGKAENRFGHLQAASRDSPGIAEPMRAWIPNHAYFRPFMPHPFISSSTLRSVRS